LSKYYELLSSANFFPERVTVLQALIPLIPTKEEIVNIKEAADKGSFFFLLSLFCGECTQNMLCRITAWAS
jgi:hypothetical protein